MSEEHSLSLLLLVKYLKDQAVVQILSRLAEPLTGRQLAMTGAPFVYFGCTELMAGSTLGDEQSGLSWRESSLIKKAIWVLLHAGIQASKSELIHVVNKLHLGIFFIQGRYYSIADRIMQVKRTSGSQDLPSWSNSVPRWFMKTVGISFIVCAVADGAAIIRANMRRKNLAMIWNQMANETDDKESKTFKSAGIHKSESPQCLVCLEPSVSSTAAPCGHIFCWRCVTTWLAHKELNCPTCRASVTPQQLLPLAHYAVLRSS